MTDIKSFRDVIDLWPTKAAFGRDVQTHAVITRKAPPVRDWYAHDRIAEVWFDAVLKAAQQRGFEEINFRLLSNLYRIRSNP